ncbi:MAG: dephospho-CoA kinase [Pirellula sp.]|jgi:dephospho-CoA kinase|nr:dephospho-CoA kinase [Pirellula sp.]
MIRPLVVGVIGGVASGKSEVTRYLEQLGALVIHADAIGHEVLREREVIEVLRERFGNEIIDAETGHIDRSRVASRVFGDSIEAETNRRTLESVVHPRIRKRIRESLDEALMHVRNPVVVLDVPLLIESGWIDSCNRVIFVDAPMETRWTRSQARGWSREQFQARESAQVDIATKRQSATDILGNAGSIESLHKEIDAWWRNHVADRRSDE